MSRAGLTVTMIVRDERANLAEVLPEAVAGVDEVIVVDTGSADGTPELARSLGATVVEMPWEDDFSKARNRGLEEVRTSHVLWLDADDRMSREDLAIVRRETLARHDRAIMLLLVNESPDPNSVSSCWQLRVFPARPEHRFEGRIHEQVQSALDRTGTVVDKLDVTVRHTGYVRPEDVVRKSRRNLELLRREVAEGRGDDIGVLYHLVRAASRCGELDEACRAARRCVDEAPSGAPDEIVQSAAVMLGQMEMRRGNAGEAERVLRSAVQRCPDDPLARFFLGDLLRKSGDAAGALRELQAARVSPVRNSNLPLPVAGLGRAIRLQLGEILESVGRPAEAAVVYREVLDGQPDERTALRSLARALIDAGAHDEAERLLDRLGETTPSGETSDVLILRALLAFCRGRDPEARELFSRVAEVAPRRWAAPLHLGHLALRGGDVPTALEHYLKSVSLADVPETRIGLAAARLESGDVEEALEQLAEVVDQCRTRPLPPGTEALSGEAFFRSGHPGEARDAFEKHLARHGPEPRIIARLADCYRALGAPDAARLGYEEALRLSPELAEAKAGLETLSAVPRGGTA